MTDYILSPSLQRAIEIALYLNKPLLLCGEPGTGKTALAKALADRYKLTPPEGLAPFYPEPLIFYTKTTSTATDLFYTYDGLARLRDAYAQTKSEAADYIELKALGKAIVMQHGTASEKLNDIKKLGVFTQPDANTAAPLSPKPASSIVLIDEIDKAPRDFPNDILNEIENYHFSIREMEVFVPSVDKEPLVPPTDREARILIIMTSNNEKNLPDAFLRRCIFHYIDFPTDTLGDILEAHFPKQYDKDNTGILIEKFNKLRQLQLNKKPATAEFIGWVQYLTKEALLEAAQKPYTQADKETAAKLISSLGILFKNYNDESLAREEFKKM